MPTQCSRDLFGYEVVDGREVVAAFDGGDHTTDAGGLLLGATDRTIGLAARFAACFVHGRAQAQVEHTVEAMVAQRVFGSITITCAMTRCWQRSRQARGQAPKLRPARRQQHAEPARARAVRACPLPQDRP